LIASLIDHTNLKPEARREDIVRLCAEAKEYRFFSVCVNPYWVGFAATELQDSKVKVCTVAGFPLGATMEVVKSTEAGEAIRAGASEVDMVLNIGALRSGDRDTVYEDIRLLADTCHGQRVTMKVILETALLTDDQKKIACELAVAAGADFVKTSTGFASSGATVEDVALMRAAVGPNVGVKASGGIRTLSSVEAMVAAGANRIGASSSVSIMREFAARKDGRRKSSGHAASQ
jgi:deoxyribose-phosphate aldolase